MQIKKMIASLAAAVLLCLNFGVVSYADTVKAAPLSNYGVSPLYEIADSCTADLTIQNGTAHCTSKADSTDTVISITVTQTLQKYWGLWIWNDVDGAAWTKSVNGSSVYLNSTKSDLKSGKYRVKATFVLTDANGKSETVTIYSNEQNVP